MIKYRCKNYSIANRLCIRNYNTNTFPNYVYNLSPNPFTCNKGVIEVDWITNITKQYILKECYNKL